MTKGTSSDVPFTFYWVSKNFGGLNFEGPLWGTGNFKKFKG